MAGRPGGRDRRPDLRGLHYPRHLVERPRRPISALALSDAVAGHPGVGVGESDAGELLDKQALATYRRRLADIDIDVPPSGAKQQHSPLADCAGTVARLGRPVQVRTAPGDASPRWTGSASGPDLAAGRGPDPDRFGLVATVVEPTRLGWFTRIDWGGLLAVVSHADRRRRQEVTDWTTMTADLVNLADHLVCQGVELVVMEATGDYWRSPYYVLEGAWLGRELARRQFPDPVTSVLSRLAGWPAGEKDDTPGPGPERAPADGGTEEVESLAAFGQVHDPGLCRPRLQAEVGQQGCDPRERVVGLLPGFTHHHEVVDITDQRPRGLFNSCARSRPAGRRPAYLE